MNTQPPSWLVYPDSRVELRLGTSHEKPELEVIGSPQGLASLAGVFLWLEAYGSDHACLSISGLPFVSPEGRIALSIVFVMGDSPFHGRVVRVDKDRQFEWQVCEENLVKVALSLHRVATNADYIDYLAVSLSPESDALLRFQAVPVGQHAT